MASLSLAMPVKSGKSGQLRSFVDEVLGSRRQEFEASEKRIGITREGWYFQATPVGDLVIVWVEADDPVASLGGFIQSREPFDAWFKAEVLDITGVDLNEGPPVGPEALMDWSAPVRVGSLSQLSSPVIN